ncbi:MAG: amidohydrolase [Saprospirales bacterium]|nr:MAG: amidohydrolase [Saprospirales bacterium]
MMIRIALICLLGSAILLASCEEPGEMADMVIHNAVILTMDKENPGATAVAISGDKILEVGEDEDVMKLIGHQTKVIDAGGDFIMPGLIEGHGHYLGFGRSLQEMNLLEVESWQELLEMVATEAKSLEPGRWITGRGWHQDKWTDFEPEPGMPYPPHDALSAVSPENPVVLVHASGHGLIANARAMELAGVESGTPDPEGGTIRRDEAGEPIGVFEETAMGLIRDAYMEQSADATDKEAGTEIREVALRAQEEAFRYGITSFQDAGLNMGEIAVLKKMAEEGELDLRLWVMLLEPYEVMRESVDQLPIKRVGPSGFTVAALKAFNDGALGSYGALLLEPYSDRPSESGHLVTSGEELRNIAALARDNGLQYCVHAIGDKANRMMLDIYGEAFDNPEDLRGARWRIEHAQHLHPDDIPKFGELGIIAAMQTVHCTSDAPFVETRLGKERAAEGAYRWRDLIDSGALVSNGTDVPVENINPFEGLYAAVTRKSDRMDEPFYPGQVMTRLEALESYTINNAIAAFEDDIKGSLSPGKLADLIILDTNLLECDDSEIRSARVRKTVLGGEVVYREEE